MKTLQELVPTRQYFIAAKDNSGNYWAMPTCFARTEKVQDWVYLEPDMLTPELAGTENTGLYRICHRSRSRVIKLFCELHTRGPEFWDRAVEDYIDEKDKSFIVKQTCKLFILNSSLTTRSIGLIRKIKKRPVAKVALITLPLKGVAHD